MGDTHLDVCLRELEGAINDRHLTLDSCVWAGIFAELNYPDGVLEIIINMELAEKSAFYREVLEEGIVMGKLAANAKDIGEFEGTPGEMG